MGCQNLTQVRVVNVVAALTVSTTKQSVAPEGVAVTDLRDLKLLVLGDRLTHYPENWVRIQL